MLNLTHVMTDLQFNGICETADTAQSGNNAIKCLHNIHMWSTRGDLCSDSSFHESHIKITFNSKAKQIHQRGK